ncbi:MAG: 3'-5' exonuclease [Lewinella sp.]|nr:3'-5' exonuclease [Lewinella sp.]
MLEQLDIANILFLDVETVSTQATFADLDESLQGLWRHKANILNRDSTEPLDDEGVAASYVDKAGIYAEFGKIVCISVGVVYRDKESKALRVRLKSFAEEDEKQLLTAFSELLGQYYSNLNRQYLCGHNIKEFDVPYICRRMIIHQLELPAMLDVAGKKPWETKHLLDTMELWKFGDRKAFTSLKLLAAVLGFPSPKDDIDGSEVGRVFWEEKDLDRIAHYCEKDVLATVQLLRRYQRADIFTEEQVDHIGR